HNHENDDEEVAQPELTTEEQEQVNKVIEQNKNEYLLRILAMGAKLPPDFGTENLNKLIDNGESSYHNEIPNNPNGSSVEELFTKIQDLTKKLEETTIRAERLKDLNLDSNTHDMFDKPSPASPFAQEWKLMKDTIQGLQKQSKQFNFEELCPYPFDTEISRLPFPPSFEIPKFDKYKSKGDPREHVKEFYMQCQEVAYRDTYLLRLFPQSLGGQALDWFFHLPKGSVTTFTDLSEKFVKHFSYNLDSEITMLDLCNTRQRPNENFASFLQRWHGIASRFPCSVPERQLVSIFVPNLNAELSFHMQMHCLNSFEEVIEKGTQIEKALISKGLLKAPFRDQPYRDTPQNQDKSKFFNRNRNIVNDGITDSRHV
ncbi:hypothetical protein KI387_018353, partial [Taxus chinensis]